MEEQQEHLNYLVDFLCQESDQYKNLKYSDEEKDQLLRSLMNIRMPKPVPAQFLDIQNSYLTGKVRERGVVEYQEIPTADVQYGSLVPHADKITVWQGDITRLKVDAIVNAANSQLLGCFVPCHGCIDNAIHSAAGIQLREECERYMTVQGHEEPAGKAKITLGYNLPAKHVIHTVGPIVRGKVTKELEADLQNCYEACMKIAMENGVRSIAFCCISTGEYHFPNDKAAKIAVDTVSIFLDKFSREFDRIIFNVFKDVDLQLYEELLS